MLRSIQRALLPLLLTAPVWCQESENPDSQTVEFVARLGEAEIGRESCTRVGDTWSTSGRFDVLGTKKGRFTLTGTRGADALSWKVTFGEKKVNAILENGSLLVEDPDTGKNRSRSIENKRVFAYEDLIWSSFWELGLEIDKARDTGELEVGTVFTALIASAGVGLDVTVTALDRRSFPHDGRQLPLLVVDISFAGAVDMIVYCDDEGLPLLVEIPSQQIRSTVTGYETLATKQPTSLVDAGPWREKLSQPDSKYTSETNVRIPMRDGVTLATDIYRPTGDGPFPTILARTPYSRQTEGGLKGPYYAARGYIFIAQDVRGRFDSDGDWYPFIHETDDGSDTIDWIADQPWSDGKVGMVGASYVGLVQWLAAKSGNPHLTCIVPQVSPPDPHENFPYEGGVFLIGAAWWSRVLVAMEAGEEINEGVDWVELFKTLPAGDMDKVLGAEEQTWFDEWLAHGPEDQEFWAPANYQQFFGEMTVPAFHVTGWWDGDQPGALMNLPAMQRQAKTERARNGQYLVVGPWTHFFNTTRAFGDIDFGDEAIVDLDSRILRFFDHYLKGVDNGIVSDPHVLTFTMGENEWRGSDTWPPSDTGMAELFLSSNGNAKAIGGDGKLSTTSSEGEAAFDSFRYDPLALPPVLADFEDLSGAEIARDMSDQADREDDLEFWSAPLKDQCTLLGPVEARLFVSTDAVDTDFVVTVYRVRADGKQLYLRDGVQRLRYAKDPRKSQPAKPGSITEVTVDCWATAQTLEPGDRLLVRVNSWAWPGAIRHMNTLEPMTTATKPVTATNTVFHDKTRPSRLRLSIVGGDAALQKAFGL